MSEREYCPTVSEHLIRKAIASLNLTATVLYANHSESVATCLLHTHDGEIASEGAGKGQHCLIGALAESVEHYVMQQGYTHAVASSTSEIRNQPALALDGIIGSLPGRPREIDCAVMNCIQTGEEVKVPLALLQPDESVAANLRKDTELSFLTRYSTNSGAAFGCSKNEALLHGLNEVIERHILSKLFMSVCGQHDGLALNTLTASTLDDIFSELPSFTPLAKEMKIFYCESIFGTFFSIAIPKRPKGRHPICPVGSGCSIDLITAIQRSTTELAQALELFDETEKAMDEKAYDLLDPCPKLRPLIKLDTLRNKIVDNSRLPPTTTLTVEQQVHTLTQRLSQVGFRPLFRRLAQLADGCMVTQVYIPGFERFNLIRSGSPVVPQRHLWSVRPVTQDGETI